MLDGQQVGGGEGGGGGGGGRRRDSNDSGLPKHVTWGGVGVGGGGGAAWQSCAAGNAGIAGAGIAGAVPLEGVLGLGTAHASVSQVLL